MAAEAAALPSVRLRTVWNWLPVFRLVAEQQSVRAAAALLRIAPSAASRSIGLLEAELGLVLFERRGRALALTDAGRSFLAVVKGAMREIDDGIQTVQGELPIRVGMLDWLAPMLAVQLGPGRKMHAAPSLSDGLAALRVGRLDALVGPLGLPGEGVERYEVGALELVLCRTPTGSTPGVAAPVDVSFDAPPLEPLQPLEEVPFAELLCAGTRHVLLPAAHPFVHGLSRERENAARGSVALYVRSGRGSQPQLSALRVELEASELLATLLLRRRGPEQEPDAEAGRDHTR